MSFELAMEPSEGLLFTEAKAGIQMQNILGRPVAFKVKVTDNNLFKIDPAVGILNPGEGVVVIVSFVGSVPVGGQSVSVSYIDAAGGDPKISWSMASGAEPCHILPIGFQ